MKKSHRSAPLIGITPDVAATGDNAEPLIVLQERYARAIQQAGAVPLVLPIASAPATLRRVVESLDGVVVSGGNFDIHPKYYGEQPIKKLGHVRKERTEFELELISLALKYDMPVLGICGGAQAINVALGGSLYQDIQSQVAGAAEHEQGHLKDRGGHAVNIVPGTKLRRIVGRKSLEVNTTHHQSVKKLGKGLIVNATAEDGVIEGIESQQHPFVLGVQWHPECLTEKHNLHRRIFLSFVSTCR